MNLMPWRRTAPTRTTSFPAFPEMSRMLEDFFTGPPALPTSGEPWAPAVSLTETPQAYAIKTELPGMNAEHVEIQVSDDTVTIKGERKQEKQEEKENVLRSELTYGAFMRRVALPSPVDADKAEAVMEKGVLTLKLPRTSVAKSRTIKVK